MSKERRLGRGLAALLGDPETTQSADEGHHDHATAEGSAPPPGDGPRIFQPDANARDIADDPNPQGQLLMLDVAQIRENPFQPRREFSESEIESLSESLKEHDMLQPVLVRERDGGWQLISGERRRCAAIRAGWKQIPARVREADDRLVAELAIVENLQRKDLSPLEKALPSAATSNSMHAGRRNWHSD